MQPDAPPFEYFTIYLYICKYLTFTFSISSFEFFLFSG